MAGTITAAHSLPGWLVRVSRRVPVTVAATNWGYQAAEGKTYCYDFHATVLHLLGIDHQRLVYRQNGIDRRLTDVHGHVVNEILA